MTVSNAAEPHTSSNKQGISRRFLATLRNGVFFCLFLVCYAFPLLLSPPTLSILDPRIRLLLHELFSLPSTQFEILRNVGGVVFFLLATFLLLSTMGKAIAKAIHIAQWLGQLAALLIGLVFLFGLNAMFFPQSNYAYALPTLRLPAFTYLCGLLLCCGAVFLTLRHWPFKRQTSLILAGGVFLACGVAFIPVSSSSSLKSANSPNIIIVGVDSLSSTMYRELHGYLPNLTTLMTSGERYTRAYTPLGRTFPAWMTILTGKYAADHGGIFNLRDLHAVNKSGLVSTLLQQQGYRTVYAIDERRFNNLDSSFGFDFIVAPKAGALDFLLQGFNDSPVTNFLAQTRLAKFIMPFSYINTESYINYDASGFVDRTLSTTADSKPLFLAIHFESAHFPYKTRFGHHKFNSGNEFWDAQANALTAVDDQVGQLMAGLKEQGRLENALVIVLSDHGESHGEVEGKIEIETSSGIAPLTSYGHGSTILSDLQNHIIFDVIKYSRGKAEAPTVRSQQVSLLDITPLITQFLATGQADIKNNETGCILVETGIRPRGVNDFKTLNEAAVAANAAGLYDIGTDGKLQLREDVLPQLAADKDIGWRCLDHITYYSADMNRYYSYELDDSGTLVKTLQVPLRDKNEIYDYRTRLLASLKSN